MSAYIHEIAAEVSPIVIAAEEANEASMVAICNLIAATAQKRRETGVLPSKAHPNFMRLHQALGHTISAQSEVLRFHGKLEENYRVLAADDIHALTIENVQRRAEESKSRRRPVAEVRKIRA